MQKLIRDLSKDIFAFVFVDFVFSLIPTFLPVQMLSILPFRMLGAFPLFCINIGVQLTNKALLRLAFVFIFFKLIVAILLKMRIKTTNAIVIVFSLVEIYSILYFYITSEIINAHKVINVFVGLLALLFYVSLIILSIFNLRDPQYKRKEAKKYTKREYWKEFCAKAFLFLGVEIGVTISTVLDKILNSDALVVFGTYSFNPKTQFLFDEWVITENSIFIILVLLLLLIQIFLIVLFVKKVKASSIILGMLYVIDLVLSIYQLNLIFIFVYALFVVVCFSRYKQLCGFKGQLGDGSMIEPKKP